MATRNTFAPFAEAALLRLEALTVELAAKAATLPTRSERIDHEPADVAKLPAFPESAR